MLFGDALVAGIGDILGFLVPIVFFVIYLLNQLLTAKNDPKQQPRNARRRAPQPAERPMRPAQAQQNPPGGPGQLNTEIEQFLKRASQRRGQQPARDRAAAAPKPPPQAPLRRPREPSRSLAVDVVPLEDAPHEDVSASVEKHLGSGKFKEWKDHLAQDVSLADQDMDQHLEKVFHHRLGKLGSETADASTQGAEVQTVVVTDAPSPAAAFAQLLRTPEGMRQAIVVSEILARPEDRW